MDRYIQQETAHERVVELENVVDALLVKRAQQGDRDAFGELVRRHRAVVYGYARAVTRESFLAEDIVQDALIRAFIHLGTLLDPSRFLPWLQRIVRNLVYSMLNSKSYVKEQALTMLPADSAEDEDSSALLDRLLVRLSGTRQPFSMSADSEPDAHLIRKEFTETIRGIVSCLNRREREIFEAHFFGQLSPMEISDLYQLTSSNVYQILSRSRKKVVQEKIKVVVDQYILNRRDMGTMGTVKLEAPTAFKEINCRTSAAIVMYQMLMSVGKSISFPMVMGLSGLACRIAIFKESVHIAGPTAYDFGEVLPRAMENLGYRTRVVDGMKTTVGVNANLLPPSQKTEAAMERRPLHESLPEALELTHLSLDRGHPVAVWDIYFPEFGLLYGYDDENRKFDAVEYDVEGTLEFDHLGRGVLEELFVLALDKETEYDILSSTRSALSAILDHYHGAEQTKAECVKGISAYDTWCDAFRSKRIEPNGNACNIAVVQDARSFAAQFFDQLGQSWPEHAASVDRIRELCREVSRKYEKLAAELSVMRDQFPFPQGGNPNDPVEADKAIQILTASKQLELEAVSLLEEMYALLAAKS